MKQHRHTVSRTTRGFTLLEVLIAVVVLATGLLALTALQGALIRSSADAKARSQVAAYVTSEIDRIRTGAPIVATKTASLSGTDDISTAAIAAGLSELSQQTEVVQYIFDDATGEFVEDPSPPGTRPYFNRVTITMSWQDTTGASRSLTMQSDISPLALTASKVLVDRTPPDDAGLRPIVRRETPLTEGMIPIATGGADDEATAATNPKPKLVGGESGTYVSDTRYDVLTYSTDPYTPEGFVRFNKRIETAIVGCVCQNNLDGFPTSGPGAAVNTFLRARAFRPAYWDGRTYRDPEPATQPVSSSPVSISQSQLCDVCCRDHKDPVGVNGPKYSPWTGQDAVHYRLDANNSFVLSGDDEQYLEACRVIRVNGTFRVTPDPKVLDNALVATQVSPPATTNGSQHPSIQNNSSATSPLLSQDGKDAYVNYAYDAISSLFFDTTAVAAEGNATDFAEIQESSFAGDTLNLPSYVPILPTGDRRWLHSRALIIDYLEQDARDLLVKVSTECESPSDAADRAQCVLPYVAMATVNTTEISNWSPRAATAEDPLPQALANEPLGYLNYARTRLRRYNSGLALFSAINPVDAASPATDEQLFIQLAAQAPATTPWLQTPSPNPSTARYFGNPLDPMRGYAETTAPYRFSLTWDFPGGNPGSPATDASKSNDPSATVTSGGLCTPNTANNTSNPYACKSGTLDAIEISLAGYNRIREEQINNPCPNAPNGSKVNRPVCVIYTFAGASVDNPAATISSAAFTTTGSGINQRGTFTIPAIVSGGSSRVTVTFSGPTQTAATYTCPDNVNPVWDIPCD